MYRGRNPPSTGRKYLDCILQTQFFHRVCNRNIWAKNFPINQLWSIHYVFLFIILKKYFIWCIQRYQLFLCFDHKTERSERLKTDKFALESVLRNFFIEILNILQTWRKSNNWWTIVGIKGKMSLYSVYFQQSRKV